MGPRLLTAASLGRCVGWARLAASSGRVRWRSASNQRPAAAARAAQACWVARPDPAVLTGVECTVIHRIPCSPTPAPPPRYRRCSGRAPTLRTVCRRSRRSDIITMPPAGAVKMESRWSSAGIRPHTPASQMTRPANGRGPITRRDTHTANGSLFLAGCAQSVRNTSAPLDTSFEDHSTIRSHTASRGCSNLKAEEALAGDQHWDSQLRASALRRIKLAVRRNLRWPRPGSAPRSEF